MIKCKSYSMNADGTADVSLFADAKDEVKDDMSDVDVIGLPKGVKIAFGSDAMTASGEMAYRKSDDTWNWL